MLTIGSPAPDFELIGSDGVAHRLSSYFGKCIVLVFYRGDDSLVCNRQLDEYNREYVNTWRDLDVALLAVSRASTESHYAFSCQLELVYPLLADKDRDVARDYGVQTSLIRYGRSTFVLDRTGHIRSELRPALGGLLTYPAAARVTEHLAPLV